jgi:hypothetical protein
MGKENENQSSADYRRAAFVLYTPTHNDGVSNRNSRTEKEARWEMGESYDTRGRRKETKPIEPKGFASDRWGPTCE